jgi:hypothetical protein
MYARDIYGMRRLGIQRTYLAKAYLSSFPRGSKRFPRSLTLEMPRTKSIDHNIVDESLPVELWTVPGCDDVFNEIEILN